MPKQIEVIYTNGVFRPSEPLDLDLKEGQHLTFMLPDHEDELENFVEDENLRAWCSKQAGENVPNLDEVRQILSKIPGSMSDVVISERDERF